MKQHIGWFASALAVASGLIIVSSAQAQPVTGDATLDNIILPWQPLPIPNPGGGTVSDGPAGLEANFSGFFSFYYDIPVYQQQVLNPADTLAQLTITINGDPASYIWVGTAFILTDNFGTVNYGGYSGSGNGANPADVVWNGNVVTWTVPLDPGQVGAIQTGNDTIYSFGFDVDPAVMSGPPTGDVTFNSLVLEPAPEPTAFALAGLGAAGLLIFRRRNK